MLLNKLRDTIDSGKFPKQTRHFGGADLIITDDPNRNLDEGKIVVITIHAGAISWLVVQLKNIYHNEVDFSNKYDFYPEIGQYILASINTSDDLFDTMHYVINEIEKNWGTK
jgi:hypothetical protein